MVGTMTFQGSEKNILTVYDYTGQYSCLCDMPCENQIHRGNCVYEMRGINSDAK